MSVTTKHPQYTYYEPSWTALDDAYIGSGAIKGAVDARVSLAASGGVKLAGTRYLPRPNGMEGIKGDTLYAAYRDRPAWFGATAHTVHGFRGAIFRKDPVIDVPTAMEPHLDDITQTGVPLLNFAQMVVQRTLLIGRYGILVDFPASTVTDDGLVIPAPQSRPYWIAYEAREILNWRTERRQGDTVLTLVVLHECQDVQKGPWGTDDFFVIETRSQYRVLRLNERGEYEVNVFIEVPMPQGGTAIVLDPTQSVVPLRAGQPLPFIPFVFFGPFSLEPHVQQSLLEPLVEINYRYYRHSADYEHALHLIALPTLYICTDAALPDTILFGSATALHIPDSNAKVGLAALDAAGLPAHQIALKTDKEEMAVFGARLLEAMPTVQETATANLNRLSGAESPLQALISTVSQGLTQALQIHGWWGGFTENDTDPAILLTLNKDIVASQMPPQMLLALLQVLQQGRMSYETFYENLKRGELTRPGVDVEDEQALIETDQANQPLAMPVPVAVVPGTARETTMPPRTNGVARPAA